MTPSANLDPYDIQAIFIYDPYDIHAIFTYEMRASLPSTAEGTSAGRDRERQQRPAGKGLCITAAAPARAGGRPAGLPGEDEIVGWRVARPSHTTHPYPSPPRPSSTPSDSSSMSPAAPRSPRPATSDLPPLLPAPPATRSPAGGPPPLETNTLALVLPHPFLFSPPLQSLLRDHYETYGEIRAWAPIRAFGRVMVVYTTFAAAERAKREGDRLVLGEDDELAVESSSPPQARHSVPEHASGRAESQSRVPSKYVLHPPPGTGPDRRCPAVRAPFPRRCTA